MGNVYRINVYVYVQIGKLRNTSISLIDGKIDVIHLYWVIAVIDQPSFLGDEGFSMVTGMNCT